LQLADIPPTQSATLGLHLVVRKLPPLISLPAKGRRLSWAEHILGYVWIGLEHSQRSEASRQVGHGAKTL